MHFQVGKDLGCTVEYILPAMIFEMDPDFAGSIFFCLPDGGNHSGLLSRGEKIGWFHCSKFYFRSIFSSCIGFKIGFGGESEHSGYQVSGELQDESIVAAGDIVEFPAFYCYPVFRSFELGLQIKKVLVSLQIRIIFRNSHQSG